MDSRTLANMDDRLKTGEQNLPRTGDEPTVTPEAAHQGTAEAESSSDAAASMLPPEAAVDLATYSTPAGPPVGLEERPPAAQENTPEILAPGQEITQTLEASAISTSAPPAPYDAGVGELQNAGPVPSDAQNTVLEPGPLADAPAASTVDPVEAEALTTSTFTSAADEVGQRSAQSAATEAEASGTQAAAPVGTAAGDTTNSGSSAPTLGADLPTTEGFAAAGDEATSRAVPASDLTSQPTAQSTPSIEVTPETPVAASFASVADELSGSAPSVPGPESGATLLIADQFAAASDEVTTIAPDSAASSILTAPGDLDDQVPAPAPSFEPEPPAPTVSDDVPVLVPTRPEIFWGGPQPPELGFGGGGGGGFTNAGFDSSVSGTPTAEPDITVGDCEPSHEALSSNEVSSSTSETSTTPEYAAEASDVSSWSSAAAEVTGGEVGEGGLGEGGLGDGGLGGGGLGSGLG